jgi:hypothetical protein
MGDPQPDRLSNWAGALIKHSRSPSQLKVKMPLDALGGILHPAVNYKITEVIFKRNVTMVTKMFLDACRNTISQLGVVETKDHGRAQCR